MRATVADPNTVLHISTGLSSLQVSSAPTSSEPTTPSGDSSPLHLDGELRDFLTEVLVQNATNPKIYTKLLVSNAAAGSVIGKAGSNINDIQCKTYARIQLSKANEYFPNTTERTLLVTGRLKQVVAALSLIFSKLVREGVAPLSPKSKAAAAFLPDGNGMAELPVPQRLLVRLLVPQPLCGVIIGKNGATIRNFAADTGTVIRVTSGEASQVPTSHRIVTIAGEQQGVLKAIALMVLKQSNDPKFPHYGELPTPGAPSLQGAAPSRSAFSGSGSGNAPAMPHYPTHFMSAGMMAATAAAAAMASTAGGPAMFGGSSGVASTPFALVAPGFPSLSLMVTEDQAGLLLDQGSRAVLEVEQMSGCQVRLDMAEGPLGTFGRLLLAGPPEATAYAQWLLGQRLAAYPALPYGGLAGAAAFTPAFLGSMPMFMQQQAGAHG